MLMQIEQLASRARVSLFMLAMLAWTNAEAAAPYTEPTSFARPGYAEVQPWDISDSGLIVGASGNVGFIYAAGVFQTVEVPYPAASTIATGISNIGTVVGTYFDASQVSHGFILDNGTFSSYDAPSSTDTWVRRISSDGRYLSGTFTDSNGMTSGFALDRWSSTFTDLTRPGDTLTIAQGINIHGQVVGSFFNPTGRGGFMLDLASGQRTDYTTIGGLDRVNIRDINDSGTISGYANFLAFVGSASDPYIFTQYPNAASSWAYGLNNQGDIVGWSSDSSTGLTVGWTAAPVPEPNALLLWLFGALGMRALFAREQSRFRQLVQREA